MESESTALEQLSSRSFVKLLHCQDMQVAASLQMDVQEAHPIYYPSTVLVYVERGQLNVQLDHQFYTVPSNSFALIQKYTHGQCFKSWTKEEKGAKMVLFVLQDAFMQRVIQHLPTAQQEVLALPDRVVPLPYDTQLKALMRSVWTYIDENTSLNSPMLELKTLEALLAIGKVRPDLLSVLRAYAQPERADLEHFMRHNFVYNISLEQLARASGRSLSTFNREFKRQFGETPHRWIKRERLELAKRLLVQTDKKPSEVYLEVGFEDLAHFSRSFKRHFGKNPSDVKQLLSA